MSTNVTYSSLFTDIQRYLERGGSVVTDRTVFEQIPRLINAAERKLAQDVKLLGQIEPLTAANPNGLQINNAVFTKPDRWRQTVSLAYGAGTGNNTWTPLFPRALEFCQYFWPDATQTDAPQFYADIDINHWWIAPTPNANYPVKLLCYMQPRLLSDDNQSNFWTEFAPNALLYGALLEATPFLMEDPRIPTWSNFWQAELAALTAQDVNRMYDRASKRETA